MIRALLAAVCLTAATCLEVGIVGAGIGGGAVAYYTRMLQGNGTNLTVFERNDYIGGRLKHTVMDGQVIELGGDAWSSANEYIVALVKELGIPTDSGRRRARRLDPISSNIGVWDGSGFVKIDSLVFGHLFSDAALAATEESFLRNLRRNYAERGDLAAGTPFESIADFLSYPRPSLTASSLDKYTSVDAASYLTAHRVAAPTQREALEPLLRVIYDQGLESHAFAALVALTSVVGADGARDGNSKVVEALLARARAAVELETAVTSVTARPGPVFDVELRTRGGGRETRRVDQLVLACPLEFVNISFHGHFSPPLDRVAPREFEHWYVTVVRARGVEPRFFGLAPSAALPENILTTANASAPFHVLQLEAALPGTNLSAWKLFSNAPLPDALLASLFTGLASATVQHWPFTFPRLAPAPAAAFQPITLAPGLHYLNGLESVASAMEGSIIAGRNVAQLMARDARRAAPEAVVEAA